MKTLCPQFQSYVGIARTISTVARNPVVSLSLALLLFPGCGSVYTRVGSPDAVFAAQRQAVGIVGSPHIVVDVHYRARQVSSWFGTVGRGVGTRIDRSKNEEVLALFVKSGMQEFTRDLVSETIAPIARDVKTLTIADWKRLPPSPPDAQQILSSLSPTGERFAVDQFLKFYATPDDGVALLLEIHLTYLAPAERGLEAAYRDAFVCESQVVRRNVVDNNAETAKEMIRSCVEALAPWIRWELAAGADRLASKSRAEVEFVSGLSMTGHVLVRNEEWLVLRGDEGIIRAVRPEYIAEIEPIQKDS